MHDPASDIKLQRYNASKCQYHRISISSDRHKQPLFEQRSLKIDLKTSAVRHHQQRAGDAIPVTQFCNTDIALYWTSYPHDTAGLWWPLSFCYESITTCSLLNMILTKLLIRTAISDKDCSMVWDTMSASVGDVKQRLNDSIAKHAAAEVRIMTLHDCHLSKIRT